GLQRRRTPEVRVKFVSGVRVSLCHGGHRETPLSSCPAGLNPNEYFGLSPERAGRGGKIRIEIPVKETVPDRTNNPHRRTLVEDPALNRWMFARNRNIYPNFRPTPKTSLLGLICGIGPLFFWYYVIKSDRDRKEKLIQEGKLERPFHLSY
ncbi:hypothetical protein GDO86_018785, partial [Hymenochirus boettgeri]